MKKFLLIVIVSLLAGVYSPGIVGSLTNTMIQVRDGVNHGPLGGAVVLLFSRSEFQNTFERHSVFNGTTDLNGMVDIEPVFGNQYNALNLEYEVSRNGYQDIWGGKTFYRGEITTFDMAPQGNGACGDGICDLSETCSNCPADCGLCSRCGNGVCEQGETCTICPADCGCGGDVDSGEPVMLRRPLR